MRGLFYTILLLVVTGCSYSASKSKELDEAQRLMHSDPTAAFSILNGMDVSEFQDSATVARWALLYSEAMVINRVSAPTDTIVNIAVDYYGRHNLNDEFLKASRLKALISSTVRTDALSTALYLQKEKEFLLYKERIKREQFIYIGLIILLIAVAIIVWMHQRIKIRTVQTETLMAEASGLKCQVDAGRGEIGRLETKLRGLLETRFELIDSLCQTYFESQGTKAERNAIIDKVKSEIEAVRTDSFEKMEMLVNDCLDNLLTKVKVNYHCIKQEDYQLLVYIACGLSSRTISLLLGETIEVVYKRKSRLKARLKEKVMPSCPHIMDIF